MKRLSLTLLFCLGACTPAGDGGTTEDPEPIPPRGQDGGAKGDAAVGGDCIDRDEDGYGEGACLGSDCDDSDPRTRPGALEICDGFDNDCNGVTDDNISSGDCPLQLGVCAGAKKQCARGMFEECGPAAYGEAFESDETRCDGADNDCDGRTDEGCACAEGDMQECGNPTGACEQGEQTCVGNQWGPCEGEVGPKDEICNGNDDDCDGTADEDVEDDRPACELTEGVCAGAQPACGDLGWETCGYGELYEADETRCDAADNDCDGSADEGCACQDGMEQRCGSDVGSCQQGVQTCAAGAWGACNGATEAAEEICDGDDNDCDGNTDEGLEAPGCALNQGVCGGALQECGGARGWLQCDAASA